MTRDLALDEAILDTELRHINFFNGRLLTGGDLEAEQSVQHAHDRHLGRAIGAGVASGLRVALADGSSRTQPVVVVSENDSESAPSTDRSSASSSPRCRDSNSSIETSAPSGLA